MLDLPGHPVLDKDRLIGGCARLPITVDAAELQRELAALPASLWGATAGRVGVHRAAEAIFLRGHAPAAGDLPIEDREPMALLPGVRHLIEDLLGGNAQRCLLARLPAGATISSHVDRAPYFWKTMRVHVPVQTHDQAWMICNGLVYSMQPGEVWALNNCTTHAVWNAHAILPRTHLICDFLPTPTLLDLLARGERDLGRNIPAVTEHLAGRGRPESVTGG